MRATRLASLLVGSLALGATQAHANTIALEGSDATGFHHDGTYTSQLFSFLKDGSSLPVLVLGTVALPTAPADTVYLGSLAGVTLSDYSALYVQSPSGCCDQNRAGTVGYEADIAAFEAAGGNLAIQNYQGGDWGAILPFATPPAGTVFGWNTPGGGTVCFDNEVFNADALAKGFTQPPVLGCWGHQAYAMSYFGPLGFISLVDSTAEFGGMAGGPTSSFLALGGSLGTPIPEPATMLLMGAGLVGFAASRKRAVK